MAKHGNAVTQVLAEAFFAIWPLVLALIVLTGYSAIILWFLVSQLNNWQHHTHVFHHQKMLPRLKSPINQSCILRILIVHSFLDFHWLKILIALQVREKRPFVLGNLVRLVLVLVHHRGKCTFSSYTAWFIG